jgi:hypothetical protein
VIPTTRRSQVSAAIVSIIFWITVGTVVFHTIENWTWIQALYFSVVTLATIGYGDLHPTTDLSRLITVIYILFAVAAAVSAISIIGTHRVEKRAGEMSSHRNKRTKNQ